MVERNGRLYPTGGGQRYGGRSRTYVAREDRALRALTKPQELKLSNNVPTAEESCRIHEEYRQTVPNNYEAIMPRIAAAFPRRDADELATAVAEWLKNVNWGSYYRYRPEEAATLTQRLKPILQRELEAVLSFRKRPIKTLSRSDEVEVFRLFGAFRAECGPVGAAKALHVLAPTFFPLWDTKIAESCGVSKESGYFEFMNAVKAQVLNLPEEVAPGVTALKALDEWNYLRLSRKRR